MGLRHNINAIDSHINCPRGVLAKKSTNPDDCRKRRLIPSGMVNTFDTRTAWLLIRVAESNAFIDGFPVPSYSEGQGPASESAFSAHLLHLNR